MTDPMNYMTNDPPEQGMERSGGLFLVSFAQPPQTIVAARETLMMKEFLMFLVKHRMITVAPELQNLDILKRLILEQYQKEIDEKGLAIPEIDAENAELLIRMDPFEKEFMEVLSMRYNDFKFLNHESLKNICVNMYPNMQFENGFKIRGTAPNTPSGLTYLKERAKLLGDIDQNFDVVAGEMYKWTPFNPDVSLIQDQTTRDSRMNDLLRGYMQNRAERAEFLEKMRQEEMRKIEEKNKERKEKDRAERKRLLAEAAATPSDVSSMENDN
jgi:hypothetical protein